MAAPRKPRNAATPELPPAHDWRTSDADERLRRKLRAAEEAPAVRVLETGDTVFGLYHVRSRSGNTYTVQLRALGDPPVAACTCTDFRINGLGTCKHVEAVLAVARRGKARWHFSTLHGSPFVDIAPSVDGATLAIERNALLLPAALAAWFDGAGRLLGTVDPEAFVERVRANPRLHGTVRLALEVEPWLEARLRARERVALRREYESRVQSGEWPAHETLVPLFPYQREGMLHLAFTERALLADEMGLGKTIQAIAACALLHRLGRARRVLVVTPASLKTEWEEQIRRFTALSLQIVYGGRLQRLAHYDPAREGGIPFFTLCNYEQIVPDALDINARLQPDIVVLDEAQRIKNWSTKTARAVKRLQSRHAFVLTGTPVENRIDELYSIVDFLDPTIFGSLFRFNREFYTFDEKGRPAGYRDLDVLHERIRPVMLRRRKAEVETELPERTDHVRLVPMSDAQRETYTGHERTVAELAAKGKRRPLLPKEQDALMRALAMMRMVCDTNYILDDADRTCPKLAELESILTECRDNRDVKVIVFSEWERMLVLVRELCARLGLGHAWHTGSVPQQKRRGEINRFKTDPACRVFLSTDSGGVGLNLQNASVVVNCDLPWNPAKLEQRIARAWRKHQVRAVTVFNLVTERSIEHGMLVTLADKRSLSEGVLDGIGNLAEIRLRSGREAQLARLEQVMLAGMTPKSPPRPTPPADPALAFAQRARAEVDGSLVACEERYPSDAGGAPVIVVVVERDAALWRPRLEAAHLDTWRHTAAPADAPRLLVLDRATQAALDDLAAAGLIATTTAGARALHPSPTADAPPLTPEERERADFQRAVATRRLKAARALLEAGLDEEATTPGSEALQALARARAIEHHLPTPPELAACARPPWRTMWPAEHADIIAALAAGAPALSRECLSALDVALARP